MGYTVAVVGVGAVGKTMLEVLEERNFPADEIRVFARTPRPIEAGGKTYEVRKTEIDDFEGVDIALFASGEEASKDYAFPIAEKWGTVVVDNSATFRMDERCPLVVPEVNPEALDDHNKVIANPNCSTIQMLVALHPLRKLANITRIVVSSYQAVSGTGRDAIDELAAQNAALVKGEQVEVKVYPHQIAGNLLPHIGSLCKDETLAGFTTEEEKMVRETQRIFDDASIRVCATCVRVPVYNSHSESVSVEFDGPVSVEDALAALSQAPNLIVQDDLASAVYPMPIEASGRDETYVGRIRKDPSVEHGLAMWVVSDNLRKGAATNAIQIAETMIERGLIPQK